MFVVILFLASHIDTTVLADGTYELIPESEGGDPEVQVNASVLTEDPDQSLEEPKANLASDHREGKPPDITQYFKLLQFIVITYLCIYSS